MATTHEQKSVQTQSRGSQGSDRDRQVRRDTSRDLARRDFWGAWNDPLDLMRRWVDRLDRPFSNLWADPRGSARGGMLTEWSPQIETFQRGDQFIVRADLPGLEKKDIAVEVQDNALKIEGERSSEHEEQDEGFYRSERSYGRFCRIVPLPEGAIADNVNATFKNGVLEVVVQAPPQDVSRGRKVDIA